MKELFKQHRDSLLFIIKFVGLYLVLNTVYGFYIEYYHPLSDPLTYSISKQVAWVLSLIQESIQAIPDPKASFVHMQMNTQTVVSVFEGCNSVNVMIVYLSFIIAFTGSGRSSMVAAIAGLIVVYLMNLIRVGLLFEVAYFYPQHLYFFHKYFFTGIIYAVVFVMWYFWIQRVKRERAHDA